MDKKHSSQSGGVNISGGRVSVGGDIVGRDKITSSGLSASDDAQLQQQFARIYRLIEQREADPNVDKAELRDTVSKIESEVKRGDAANSSKVERWLRFLAGMADDVAAVTIAALAHPIAGVAKAIQLVAQRAEQDSI